MYVAYLDEFGHEGDYISRHHAEYKTHPVFGYGGYIIPANKIRQFSAIIHNFKSSRFASEIKNSGRIAAVWEKKGSGYIKKSSYEKNRSFANDMKYILRELQLLGGRVIFFGQVKERVTQVETSLDRNKHCMINVIRILGKLDDNVLVVLDSRDPNMRRKIFESTAGYLYGNKNFEAKKVVEVPMQVESHLYPTVQYADWVCMMLGKLAAYKYDPDFIDEKWIIEAFGRELKEATHDESKINCKPDMGLTMRRSHMETTRTLYNKRGTVPASADSLWKLKQQYKKY